MNVNLRKVNLVFTSLAVIFSNFNLAISREKRFLQFPSKTNIVITMSLLKLFPKETILNTLTEFDVLFPVPAHPFAVPSRQKRQIERNFLHTQLQQVAESFGFDGDACLAKFVCEARKLLVASTENNDNVLFDVFEIIFEPGSSKHIGSCSAGNFQNACRLPFQFAT